MGQDNKRFICIRDPVDSWVVWDNVTDRPAEWPALLVGLPEWEAVSMRDFLNAEHDTNSNAA